MANLDKQRIGGVMNVIYETKVTQLTVRPVKTPIFARGVTHVAIDDEGAGEFVTLTQPGDDVAGKVAINPDEWPTLRDAIDRMIKRCAL